MAKSLNKKHKPSGFNHHFDEDFSDFEDYIRKTQTNLLDARIDLNSPNKQRIIEANMPFVWRPNTKPKKGILLVHGLLESPFSLWDLGKHFFAKDFLVKSVLLPGHGTVPGDLTAVKFDAWLKCTRFALESFKNEVDEIYLLGFSAGACLSILATLDCELPIAGLFLFSPLIQLKTNFAVIANWMSSLGLLYKPARWYQLADDLDYAKYESFPYDLIHQAYLLTQEIQGRHIKLDVPIFMSFSRDDETISCLAAENFFLQQPNPHNQLLIYTAETETSLDPRITYRPSRFPEENILHFSHVCIHISPDNDHYGRDGDYHPTLESKIDYAEPQVNYRGALLKEDLSKYYLRRLTYNPDFDYLLKAIDRFLEKIYYPHLKP